MDIKIQVRRVLERNYPTGDFQLCLLADSSKYVYHVQRVHGPDWVVRAYPDVPKSQETTAAAELGHLLRVLESRNFPSERVIATTNGLPIVQHNTAQFLVTSFLGDSVQRWHPATGQFIDNADPHTNTPSLALPYIFYGLGALLGELHALPQENTPGDALPPAGMQPSSELTWAASTLEQIAHPIPDHLHDLYRTLKLRVQNLSRFETCPQSLIHSDCHFGNAVVTPTGAIRLIDWEGAGIGAAVTDLGSLLSLCLLPTQDEPDDTCIRAVVRGYLQYRTLSAVEQAVLMDAIQLRTLVLLAACFDQRSQVQYDETELLYGQTYDQWRRCYQSAQQIANHARRAFSDLSDQ